MARALALPASVALADAGLAVTNLFGGSDALGGLPAQLAITGALTALEGAPPAPQRIGELQQAGYDVVDDAALPSGADAAYDGADRSIDMRASVVSQGLAASSRLILDRLLDGALGNLGKTTAGAAEQASANDHHELSAAVALVAHENVHAVQDLAGAGAGDAVVRPDGTIDTAALRDHVLRVELPAQLVQEQTQARYGATPRTTGYQTIAPGGHPLPAEQAVDNIIAQRGESIVAGLQGDAQQQPGKRFPGKRFPGKRFPGDLAT